MSVTENVTVSDELRAQPIRRGTVLVACDGSSASQESLFNAARLAAHTFGGPIAILGVCEPTPAVSAGMDRVVVSVTQNHLGVRKWRVRNPT